MNQWELSDPGAGNASIAIAIDKDKNSQSAFKWALDNIITRGATVALIHVTKPSSGNHEEHVSALLKDIFVPFRCFSTRKEVQCKDIVLEDTDIAKSILDFVSQAGIEKLVLGAPSKSGFARTFKSSDLTSIISKSAPEFCSVYIISKGKLSSVRNATRPALSVSSSSSSIHSRTSSQASTKSEPTDQFRSSGAKGEASFETKSLQREPDFIKSPFNRPGVRGTAPKSIADMSDISFVSSGRPSMDYMYPQRLSNVSDGMESVFDSMASPPMSGPFTSSYNGSSSLSFESSSSTSQTMEDVEAEMKRLRLELKQTMDMYSTACKEALSAKQKAKELHRWKMEEERRLEESRLAEEAALALAEQEKAKCRAAMEAAEASKRLAELEAQKRILAETKAQKEADERKNSFSQTDLRYRKYRIDEIETATENFSDSRKIGEGGYGPVYRCFLDHTSVAVKVLRPDAAQGRSQFNQEIEILSCIRHPNMVLLLGACPEYGCLVYEYMANGSLEDRLFRRGNSPSISWQHRFRIAAEIATGLLFLHQSKPEPLVHRDLKPANILLDRNYVSKISDVGLARLVPPSVADNVTQYLMTSTAGTFCYIDPEYQQTGMLGTKSDIYSLGIILLQILTGKPPMGLTHHVERSIEKGKFMEMLDQTVPDWPVEEALGMAKMALKCAELRRRDRPDLATVILPALDRLRELGEDSNEQQMIFQNSPRRSEFSSQERMSGPHSGNGNGNSRSRFSPTMGARKNL